MAGAVLGHQKTGKTTDGRPVQVAGVTSSGVVTSILVDSDGNLTAVAADVPTLKADEALNDSDKTFTVATGEVWQIYSIWAEYVASSTAGTRQLEIQIQDSATDVTLRFQAGTTQAADETRNYLFAAGLPDLTAFRDTQFLMTPLPFPMIYPAGSIIRVFDNNAVDAAVDDMNIQMWVGVSNA